MIKMIGSMNKMRNTCCSQCGIVIDRIGIVKRGVGNVVCIQCART